MDTLNDTTEQPIYKRSKSQIKKLKEQKLVEESDAKLVEDLFCIINTLPSKQLKDTA
jgi:hypothetical protein